MIFVIIVNKCAAHGCLSGYVFKKDVGANTEELNSGIFRLFVFLRNQNCVPNGKDMSIDVIGNRVQILFCVNFIWRKNM